MQTELNSSLAEYMCSKDTNSFWRAWRKRFCLNKLKSAQIINGKIGDKNIVDEFSSFYPQNTSKKFIKRYTYQTRTKHAIAISPYF